MSSQVNPYSDKCCPSCGAMPTAGVVAGGLCPRCMLVAGLAKRDPEQTRSANASARSHFEPPTPVELAGEFPEFEVLELAGRGGMGAVYKATQKDLGRIVALKILPPEVAEDPAFAVRFEREARALAMLNHPNIVQVYQSGKTNRFYYFVMEFVDGVNLRQTIRAGTLQPNEALAIVPQICEALEFAHNAGVVHRDIKPENILLDKNGHVKVTDFGLAKMVDTGFDGDLTHTQQVMGTVHYMAPEQVHETRKVDHRADIYSLGVVFYELLTGQLPLGRFAMPSETTTVDPRLDQVVLRTLENEPDRRYQAASEVKSDIDQVSHSAEQGSRQPDPPRVAPMVPQLPTLPPVKTVESARLQAANLMVKWPATFMIVLGLITAGISGLGFIISLRSTPYSQLITPPNLFLATRYELLEFAFLFQMLFCILFAIAGRTMLQLRWWSFDVSVCIVAILLAFVSPGFWTAGLGLVAVWSLVVLYSPNVRSAFLEQTSGSISVRAEVAKTPEQRIQGPGTWLEIAGYLGIVSAVLAILLLGFAILFLGASRQQFGHLDLSAMEVASISLGSLQSSSILAQAAPQVSLAPASLFLLIVLATLLHMPIAILMILAGRKMRRGESYGFVHFVSILALLPINPIVFLASFPIGVWSLVTLSDLGVKRFFEERELALATGR